MEEDFDLSKAIDAARQMLSEENGENPLAELIGKLSTQNDDSQQNGENLFENLVNKLTEGQNSECASKESNGFDLSGLLSGISGGSEAGIDINMLMKLQKVMSAANRQKSNANLDFLKALKPFLKQERRQKLDNAIKILNLTKILKALKNDE